MIFYCILLNNRAIENIVINYFYYNKYLVFLGIILRKNKSKTNLFNQINQITNIFHSKNLNKKYYFKFIFYS